MRDEQLGWRDERISARHRTWGCDCPAADIDFLVLEYDGGVASDLVEYKHDNAAVDLESASNRALKRLSFRLR
jgi:hypothetical protein